MATAGPSNSLPIPHSFTPDQLAKILSLADIYMDPKEYFLFKYGCDEDAAIFFKQSILPRLDILSDILDLEQVLTNQLKHKTFNRPSIMNHVWAHMARLALKNCDLLLTANIGEGCSWQIFMGELKAIHANYQPTKESIAKERRSETDKINRYDYSRLDTEAIQKCFLDFMGQLHKIGSERTVKLIHQFFFLVNKVAKEEASGMDRYWLGTFVAPAIYYALFRNLHPKEEVENISHDECAFFAKICEFMLQHPIFSVPFHEADYRSFFQDADRFSALRTSILRIMSQSDEHFVPSSGALLRTLYPTHVINFATLENSAMQSLENCFTKITISDGVTTTVRNPLIPLLHSRDENRQGMRKTTISDILAMKKSKTKKISSSATQPSMLAPAAPLPVVSSSSSIMTTSTSSSSALPPQRAPGCVLIASQAVHEELKMVLPAYDHRRKQKLGLNPGASDLTPRPPSGQDVIKPKGM
ncbi:MAG: hypothetical protein HYX61_03730 [Gammaproteobacteria bacterium]|jgi:hypothetical protein|nr:hypothetical protein [Gammaproteobacteria bacterium]